MSDTTELATFQTAFAADLQRIVNDLPLPADARVLDAPCGDGFYTPCLARRLRGSGSVVGVDFSDAAIERAMRRNAGPDATPMRFLKADAYALPFDDASFDAAWCAQSLISLDDPVRALTELRRVVVPGGMVAVLENDDHHHLLLPWPEELEPALHQALTHASRERYGKGCTLFAGRHLRQMMTRAGLTVTKRKTYAVDRQSPLSPEAMAYVRKYLETLRAIAGPHLDPARRTGFDALTDPDSPAYLLRRPELEVTWLGVVCIGLRSE